MLNATILREAAFDLLASSTSQRYIREARRLARETGLAEAVQSDARKRVEAADRVGELLRQIEGETERSPAEIEAAVVLCALARAGAVEALRPAAASSSVWIRSLASWLLAHGPSTVEEIAALLDPFLVGSVGVEQPFVEARDAGDRKLFPRAA
jgi:hypothetical protein